MSRIIKAAELQVLVPGEDSKVIRSLETGEQSRAKSSDGTILNASELISEAKTKAEEILQAAVQEAEEMHQECEQELEQIRKQCEKKGFEQGYEDGFTQGQENASKEATALIRVLKETVDSGAEMRARALQRLEQDFLKLSVILAERIIRRQIEQDSTWLKPIIDDALSRLGSAGQCKVRLSADDYNTIEQGREQYLNGSITDVSFQLDSTLTKGSCIIESENGTIDARLEKRLGQLAHYLLEVLYDDQS